MTSPDEVPDDLETLRARFLEGAREATLEDEIDIERLGSRSIAASQGHGPATEPHQVSIRLHGAGVVGHDVPVHEAAQILDAFQGVLTSVGKSLRRRGSMMRLPRVESRFLSVEEATELRLRPSVLPGSVVFTLTAPAVPAQARPGLFPADAVDGFLETALRRLFAVFDGAAIDDQESAVTLRDSLLALGSDPAAKLSRLVKRTIDSDIELDLKWRGPLERRAAATLDRRGSLSLQAAIATSSEQLEPATFEGVFHTVSDDGKDPLRLELDDGKSMRLTVDDQVGPTLRGLLGVRVRVGAEKRTLWNLNTGKTTISFRLLEAREIEEADVPLSSGTP